MRNVQKQNQKYKSFEEYRKNFFPCQLDQKVIDVEKEDLFAINLAIESLKKVEEILKK